MGAPHPRLSLDAILDILYKAAKYYRRKNKPYTGPRPHLDGFDEDIADLVSESLLKLLSPSEDLGRSPLVALLNGWCPNPEAYIWRIVRSAQVPCRRKALPRGAEVNTGLVQDPRDGIARVDAADDLKHIRALLDATYADHPDRLRAIRAVLFEGMPTETASEVYKIPLRTLQHHIRRFRELVRSKIAS